MNFKLIRGIIRDRKIPMGGLSTRSTLGNYAIAFFIEAGLFLIAWRVSDESESLFAIFFLLSAMIVSLLGGKGAGYFAGILASVSVDFLYIRPVGTLFTAPSSLLFFAITLGTVHVSVRGVQYFLDLMNRSEKARSDLETAVNAREELLAVVAHDLRQPISGLSLKIQLAIKGMKAGKADFSENVLIESRKILGKMDTLIQDLLDGAKAGAGEVSLNKSVGDVTVFCRECFEFFQPQATRKNVHMSMRMPISKVSPIEFDAHRISRVLSNLLSNALKFTLPGGAIEIAAEETRDGFIEISVRDTGPGIPKSDQPKLFERHWQAKSTAHLGTGLGLYISRGIVESHGGSIRCESEPGRGTIFSFRLPTNVYRPEFSRAPTLLQ